MSKNNRMHNKIEDFTSVMRAAGYVSRAEALENYVAAPFAKMISSLSPGTNEDFIAIVIKPAMSRWDSFVANKIWQQIDGATQQSKLDRTCAKIAEFLLKNELVYADYDLDVQMPEKEATDLQADTYKFYLGQIRC